MRLEGAIYFYLQALTAKGWSPKERRGKENALPVNQPVGFELAFDPQLNHLATVSCVLTSIAEQRT